MSAAVIKVIPLNMESADPMRLNVTARYDHRTVQFRGDVFAFLELIMKERWTGVAKLTINQGVQFMGMEFDFREKVKE